MLAIFNAAFNAVVPIILIVLLGYFLRRKQFLSDNFLSVGNKLVFRVLLPVMLFINVYNIPSFSSIPWDIVVYCIATTLLLFALGLVAAITSEEAVKTAAESKIKLTGAGAAACQVAYEETIANLTELLG